MSRNQTCSVVADEQEAMTVRQDEEEDEEEEQHIGEVFITLLNVMLHLKLLQVHVHPNSIVHRSVSDD